MPIPNIYLNTVSSGSTVITGTVSATDFANAGSIQDRLGGSISGFTVLSFSSLINYGDQPYIAPEEVKEEKTNVGLIVGVVIGSVAFVVIIIIVVYCVCKNKN